MSGTPPTEIVWKLRLKSTPSEVYEYLSTDAGREAFWVEQSEESDGIILLCFPDGETIRSRVLERCPDNRYSLTYFEDSVVTFELSWEDSGTVLKLRETEISPDSYCENLAGWISVLMSLKARADHGIDLRNHDERYSWANGYLDN